jgi:hypothetical protein
MPTHTRGQTGVDFIVGVGIFLLTIGFVVSFVPGMLTPFGDDTASPLVTDRVADELATDLLSTGPGTDTLDPDRTQAFFAAGTVPDRLAVPDGTNLNVTVMENVPDSPVREIATSGGTRLALGPTVPDMGASVSTATRTAALSGTAHVVEVRTW